MADKVIPRYHRDARGIIEGRIGKELSVPTPVNLRERLWRLLRPARYAHQHLIQQAQGAHLWVVFSLVKLRGQPDPDAACVDDLTEFVRFTRSYNDQKLRYFALVQADHDNSIELHD